MAARHKCTKCERRTEKCSPKRRSGFDRLMKTETTASILALCFLGAACCLADDPQLGHLKSKRLAIKAPLWNGEKLNRRMSICCDSPTRASKTLSRPPNA